MPPFTVTIGIELYPLPPDIRLTDTMRPFTSDEKFPVAAGPPACGLLKDKVPLAGHPVPLYRMFVTEPVRLTLLIYEVRVMDRPAYTSETGAALESSCREDAVPKFTTEPSIKY